MIGCAILSIADGTYENSESFPSMPFQSQAIDPSPLSLWRGVSFLHEDCHQEDRPQEQSEIALRLYSCTPHAAEDA